MSTEAPARPVEAALRGLLDDALSTGDTRYAVDGLTPSLVATPRTPDELAAALTACDEHGAAVIPWGGGTHMSLGNVPARYDVAFSTAKLDRVLEYEPTDLTVTVEAGVTMDRLQRRLAEHGQFLPVDALPDATVGGVLATAVSGHSAYAYGLPRDWLLGCRVALPDGRLVRGGGRVVKNVAGYDLPRLFAGSLGTLGVIVEATFKVAPLPRAQETLVARFESLDGALQAVQSAHERSLALRALALRIVDGAFIVGFRLAGVEAALDRTRRDLADVCARARTEQLQRDASDRWWAQVDGRDRPAGESTVLRASLVPAAVPAFLTRLPAASEGLAYPTTGIVIVRLPASYVELAAGFVAEARRWVADVDGSVVVTAAPSMVKERLDVWDVGRSARMLMKRVKEQFDPRETLNPGRYVRFA